MLSRDETDKCAIAGVGMLVCPSASLVPDALAWALVQLLLQSPSRVAVAKFWMILFAPTAEVLEDALAQKGHRL